ncbi:hypothetical protein GCM10023205_29510 [Yinghuangia aomiensis]|uniref:Uncharacterized protein n=1 Tax=Yinghuangia aomiensis TaxID=676205 RepID=A0ABP9H871_9ACTN
MPPIDAAGAGRAAKASVVASVAMAVPRAEVLRIRRVAGDPVRRMAALRGGGAHRTEHAAGAGEARR